MDRFVGTFCIGFDGSSGKILACDAGGPEFKSRLFCLQLFHCDILGSQGSNLVFIIPFGFM